MRILVISNFYPPYYVGGYELACEEMVEVLKTRGHQIRVLTGTYGVDAPQVNSDVYRWLKVDLKLEPKNITKNLFKDIKKEIVTQRVFKRLLHDFSPDLIYIWNLRGISISFLFLVQRMKFPICYFVFDPWLATWEEDRWYHLWNFRSRHLAIQMIKMILRPFLRISGLVFSDELDLSHVQFASQYLKEAFLEKTKAVTKSEVIYWGVDIKRFSPSQRKDSGLLRLLYAGQLGRHKGVQVVVRAIVKLVKEKGYSFILSIAGEGSQREFLEEQINKEGLNKTIKFLGMVPRHLMPSVYCQHDILIFPSIWREPWGLVLLEAMACGLAVVSTATGGNKEFLVDEENCLIFPPNDGEALAKQVERLISKDGLRKKIALAGRKMVEERFDISRTMDKIEKSLRATIGEEE